MSAAPGQSPSSGWDLVRAGQVLSLINGRAFKPAEWGTTGLPIVRIQNLNDPTAPFNYYAGELPAKFKVSDGELLFAWSGTPGTSFGAHIWARGPAWLNQHIFRVLFDEAEFDKRFLRYAINRNLNEYIRLAHGGAGLAHITKGRFEDSLLLRPPIEVQREIVEFIEEQSTRLDEGVAQLQRVQANLKRYRAAVLKAACEGRLVPTEADLARRAGRPYEPASALLERIRAEKAKLAAANVAAPSRRSTQRRDAAATLPPDLPPLPEGWSWATPAQIASGERHSLAIGPFGSDLRVADYAGAGVPLVFVRNIRSASFGGRGTVFVSVAKAEELAAHLVSPGDVLVTKMGDPPGDACLYPDGEPDAVITADCIKLRVAPNGAAAGYVVHTINSPDMKGRVLAITEGVAQLKVSLRRFASVPLPTPPLAEQHRIAAEVGRRLSLAGALACIVTANLHRATRLRQSVLASAFTAQQATDLTRAQALRDFPQAVECEAKYSIDRGRE